MNIEIVKIQNSRQGGLAGFTFDGGLDSRCRTQLFFPDRRNPGRFVEAKYGEEWIVEILYTKNNLHWCRFIEPVTETKAREEAEAEARAEAHRKKTEAPRIGYDGHGFRLYNIPESVSGLPEGTCYSYTRDQVVAEAVAAKLGLKIQGLK